MSYFRDQLEEWLKTLDVEADLVYDVGGADLPVKKRVKSWDVKKYEILDLPDYDLHGFNGARDMADVVFCLEVFEYIYDPVKAMRNLAIITKPMGTLYISFPFVYPHHEPAETDYLRYTKQGAIKLLEDSRFKILEIVSRTTKVYKLAAFYADEKMKYKGSQRMETTEDVGYMIKAERL